MAMAVLLISIAAAAATQSRDEDQRLVDSLFPQALAERGRPHLSSFQRADFDGNGAENYIVAAYGNGVANQVRVIRTFRGVKVVDESDVRLGLIPRVELEDMDGDGIPEVFVDLAGMTWAFRWRNGHLLPLTPCEFEGHCCVTLGRVERLDLDGDGILELIESRSHEVLRKEPDGCYVRSGSSLLAAKQVYRYRDWRFPSENCWFKTTPGSSIRIAIVNGDLDGESRMTAVVKLNGKAIVAADDPRWENRTFVIDTISGSDVINNLEVWPKSAEGTELTLSVQRR
jgi:hypothetical protein